MNELCTFIIPCASHHLPLVDRAIASVQAQTIPALFDVRHNDDGTPALARNIAVISAKTPFVSFLDADDWLEPTFLETMLMHWQPAHYVYSDWYVDGGRRNAPDCNEPDGYYTRHLVNMLISRAAFLDAGGFNISIPIEDTEFYWRLRGEGYCGIRAPFPLVHYTEHGARSLEFEALPNKAILERELTYQYRRNGDMCCGMPDTTINNQLDAPPDGMVLARVMSPTNKRHQGQVTGTVYPNAGHGKIIPVDPRDVEAMPHIFEVVMPKQRVLDLDAAAARDEIIARLREGIDG